LLLPPFVDVTIILSHETNESGFREEVSLKYAASKNESRWERSIPLFEGGLVYAFVVHQTPTPGQSIWCAGLSGLSRSSNQINQIDYTNQTDQTDQTDQSLATHREMGSGIVSSLDSSGPFGSVADFKTIAAGILEKDSVVARPFVISRAFDVPSSRPDDDLSQLVDLAGTVCPEGDPAFVGDMPGRLSDAKKLRSTARSGCFELQPAFDPDVACEPQCRQECFL
jgi:hypothetical protein